MWGEGQIASACIHTRPTADSLSGLPNENRGSIWMSGITGEAVMSFWLGPKLGLLRATCCPALAFQRLTKQRNRAESNRIFPEINCHCSAAIYAKELNRILFTRRGCVLLLLSCFCLAANRSLICFTSSKKRSGSRSWVASAQSLYQRSSVSLFIMARLKHRIRPSGRSWPEPRATRSCESDCRKW
jgi:hypothetical protein